MGKTTIDMTERINLPVGFRFLPTDEELVVHYLAKKVSGFPLPAAVIPEFDVFQTHPCLLPGDVNERRYFCSRKSRNGNRNKVWKQMGKVKVIENNKVAATRKNLVFCEKKGFHSQRDKTQWFLREYGFVGTPSILSSNPETSGMAMEEDWVIHCLFKKRRRPRKSGSIEKPRSGEGMKMMWPRMKAMAAQEDEHGQVEALHPCSSCSKAITEVCFHCEDEEESSPFARFP